MVMESDRSYNLVKINLHECDCGWGGREGANFGCPIRRVRETVGDFSDFRCSSAEDPGSSDDITIY